MNDKVARPVGGSYGSIGGVEITEDVIAHLVDDAERGFPNARFRAPGRPARTDEATRAVTVRLSETELAAMMTRAEREHRTRSEAIRAAIAEWARASA